MRHSGVVHVGLTMRMAIIVPMDPYEHHHQNEDSEECKKKDHRGEQHDEDKEEGMRMASV